MEVNLGGIIEVVVLVFLHEHLNGVVYFLQFGHGMEFYWAEWERAKHCMENGVKDLYMR